MNFFNQVAGWTIFSIIMHLVILLVFIWLAFRFVKAHELLAESLRKIERALGNSDLSKSDRYKFGDH